MSELGEKVEEIRKDLEKILKRDIEFGVGPKGEYDRAYKECLLTDLIDYITKTTLPTNEIKRDTLGDFEHWFVSGNSEYSASEYLAVTKALKKFRWGTK